MIHAVVVVREPGGLKPMAWHRVRLPELPAVGNYLTISMPADRAPLGTDLIVRRVWWLLDMPEEGAEAVGEFVEVFIETDVAEGPYSAPMWRREVAFWRAAGREVEELQVARSLIGTAPREAS